MCTRMVNRSDGRVAQFFLAFMIHNSVPPEVDSFNIAIRAALVERDTCLHEVSPPPQPPYFSERYDFFQGVYGYIMYTS